MSVDSQLQAPPPVQAVKRALWRKLLLALTINTLVGVFVWIVSGSPLWRSLLTLHVVGLSIFIGITLTFSVIKPSAKREPYYLVGAILIGAVLGTVFNWLARWDELIYVLEKWPVQILVSLLLMMMTAAVIASVLWGREKASHLEAAWLGEQAKRFDQDKQLMAAQLRMLQAQIEPHFLFNTLATVQSLIDSQPALAKRMLGLFNDYLRASLARNRDSRGTVRQEFELLQAYLGILQIRMGERLRFSLHCPEHLFDIPLPPMLIQPLVENAVHHGLEPKIAGGELSVSFESTQDQLIASVSDSGLGLSEMAKSQGIGLANVRARLSNLYGHKAKLTVASRPQGGVNATISIPLERL